MGRLSSAALAEISRQIHRALPRSWASSLARALRTILDTTPAPSVLVLDDPTGIANEPYHALGKDGKGWKPRAKISLKKISFLFNQQTGDADDYIFEVHKWDGVSASVKIGEILGIDNGVTGFHNHELETFTNSVIDPVAGERLWILVDTAGSPGNQVTGNEDHAIVVEFDYV